MFVETEIHEMHGERSIKTCNEIEKPVMKLDLKEKKFCISLHPGIRKCLRLQGSIAYDLLWAKLQRSLKSHKKFQF